MDKYRAAIADPDTSPHAYAEPDSVDLAHSVVIADAHVQRDALAHVTTANPSYVRFSDANAERVA